MKNSNRLLSIITIVLLVANIVTLSMLWFSHHRPGPDKGKAGMQDGPFEYICKELSLTPEQKTAYGKLKEENQQAQQPLRDSMGKAKDAFFSLLKNEQVPDSLLKDYSERSSRISEAFDMLNFRHFQQVRALCNPEQKKKFDSLIITVIHQMAPQRHGPPPGDRRPPPPPHGKGREGEHDRPEMGPPPPPPGKEE